MNLIDLIERVWWAGANVWRAGKDTIEHGVPVDNMGLHAIGGLLIFGTAIFVGKHSWRWLAAWALTLAFALWNELVDITTERWPDITEQLAAGAFDLGVTMAMPTLLWVIWAWLRRSTGSELRVSNDGSSVTRS